MRHERLPIDMSLPPETTADQSPEQQQIPQRSGWFRRLFADILFVVGRDKKWWLLPPLVLLLILAGLLAFAAMAGPLAPFIYPLL